MRTDPTAFCTEAAGCLRPSVTIVQAYLKLSMLIHPDKLRGYDDATKAFQVHPDPDPNLRHKP